MLSAQEYQIQIEKYPKVNYIASDKEEQMGSSKIALDYKFVFQEEKFEVYLTTVFDFDEKDLETIIEKKTGPITNTFVMVLGSKGKKIEDIYICLRKIKGNVEDLYMAWTYQKLTKEEFVDFDLKQYKYKE